MTQLQDPMAVLMIKTENCLDIHYFNKLDKISIFWPNLIWSEKFLEKAW